jgi:hypothetical protein
MQPFLRVKRSEGEREAHVINGALQPASAAPLNDDVADLAPASMLGASSGEVCPGSRVSSRSPASIRRRFVRRSSAHASPPRAPAGRRRREPPWRDRQRWARFAVARARLMAKPHLSGASPETGAYVRQFAASPRRVTFDPKDFSRPRYGGRNRRYPLSIWSRQPPAQDDAQRRRTQ